MALLLFFVLGFMAKVIIFRFFRDAGHRVITGSVAAILLGPILFRILAANFTAQVTKADLVAFVAVLVGTYAADAGAWIYRTIRPKTAAATTVEAPEDQTPDVPASWMDRLVSGLILGGGAFAGAGIYAYVIERPWTVALQWGLWGLLMGLVVPGKKRLVGSKKNGS